MGLVKYALDNGQSVHSVVNGMLPLHAAAANGDIGIVTYLVEKAGADVNARRFPRGVNADD
ncbi:hypothetical protein HK102_008702, partial [Quaeritorhiza haematococci]